MLLIKLENVLFPVICNEIFLLLWRIIGIGYAEIFVLFLLFSMTHLRLILL